MVSQVEVLDYLSKQYYSGNTEWIGLKDIIKVLGGNGGTSRTLRRLFAYGYVDRKRELVGNKVYYRYLPEKQR